MTLTYNRPLKKRTGFTLVELLIVVACLAVLLGLSLPRFKRTFEGLELKNTAFNLYKLANFAAEKAVMESKNFTLHLDPRNASYGLKNAGRFGKEKHIPEILSLESSRQDFIFTPDGNCLPGEINIKDAQGSGYRIKISGLGNVEIKDLES